MLNKIQETQIMTNDKGLKVQRCIISMKTETKMSECTTCANIRSSLKLLQPDIVA